MLILFFAVVFVFILTLILIVVLAVVRAVVFAIALGIALTGIVFTNSAGAKEMRESVDVFSFGWCRGSW